MDRTKLKKIVLNTVNSMSVVDIHTHLFDPSFDGLLLWGIDELLTYHYLVAELFRACPNISYREFWKMSKTQQADLIWQELFIKRSPISEACRGVITVLNELGLSPKVKSLDKFRNFFKDFNVYEYTDLVFKIAKVEKVYMTNDPLNLLEKKAWLKSDLKRDSRFLAVLRIDSAIVDWPKGVELLKASGYDVESSLSGLTIEAIKKYLRDWIAKMDAKYMAVSLPPTFRYPNVESCTTNLFTKAVLPVAKEIGIPVALMIGVKKLVNPELLLAGDSVGKGDIDSIEKLCCDFPDVNFMVTMLSRENMHELCVAARKFKNLLPFGCWWFLNTPSLIEEISKMRLELLGFSFVPQHSDSRVLDQLIYKWKHSREIIGNILLHKYVGLVNSGWKLSENEIKRDISILFSGKQIDFARD